MIYRQYEVLHDQNCSMVGTRGEFTVNRRFDPFIPFRLKCCDVPWSYRVLHEEQYVIESITSVMTTGNQTTY